MGFSIQYSAFGIHHSAFRMRVLMLSKALVEGAYQKKAEALAALPGVELTVAVPPAWREPGVGVRPLERCFTRGYRLVVLPIVFNGRHHIHCYPTLGRLVAALRPDVFHIDEEAFNLATFLAMRVGVRYGARCCFYNWATIDRWYPPPFAFFERYVFRHAAHAIAGAADAARIIRKHGYRGPISVLPQFGVDPDLFSPRADDGRETVDDNGSRSPFVVGYIGRLVPQKGVLDLVEALATLPPSVRLRLIGDGALRDRIVARAGQLGVGERLEIRPAVSSTAVPHELRQLDVLVLPSRTTRTWKEQFGRVLIEAMSCGVPVIGSSSGEIPRVIGDAGLIYPEGDVAALAAAIRRLVDDPALAAGLGQRGRARVLERYTQAALAQQYYAVYRSMLEGRHVPAPID
jgi:glycosyltransferase involved in cell wall biosynthesis